MAGTVVTDAVKSSSANPTAFQNSGGTEVGQLCRAWVNFNGVTTATIRASFNVSSVTRNAAGDYTVNLTNAMADANYAVAMGRSNEPSVSGGTIGVRSSTQAAGSFRMFLAAAASSTGQDDSTVYVSIFR